MAKMERALHERGTKGNLSREEQIRHGIEQLAIAWKYVHQNENRMKVKEFGNFIAELNYLNPDDPESAVPASDINRHFRNIRILVENKFDIMINLQQSQVTWNPGREDKVYPIVEYYLKSFGDNYDANAVHLLLKNISYTDSDETFYKKGQKLPGLALYYLVVFNFAIKFRIPLRFNFRELMGTKTSERYVLPLSLACRNGYVDLIGVDLNEEKKPIKQFILSCIEGLGSDLYDEFQKAKKRGFNKPVEFDYDDYKKTAEYHFQRPMHEYTVQMFAHTYNHFCHSYLIDHEIVEKKNDYDITVKFKNSDWRTVSQILMNYAGYISLKDEKEISSEINIEGSPKDKLPENCGKKEFPLMCRIRNQYERMFQQKKDSK